MCDYDCMSKKQQQAIDHWNTVRRTMLQSMLDDESEQTITAARQTEENEKTIARLSKTVRELEPNAEQYSQALGSARDRLFLLRGRVENAKELAATGAIIVKYLRRQLAQCDA